MISSDEELIKNHIREDTAFLGAAEARIAKYGVPVWALIGYLKVVGGDVERVANDYAVPVDVVRAAKAFYDRNRDAIDARLIENAPAP